MKPARRMRRRSGRKIAGALTMTSLVDILTILLIFLLKSFSSEGALLHAAQDLELPETSSKEGVTEGDLVIAITDRGVSLGEEMIPADIGFHGGAELFLPGLATALEEASGGDPAGRRVLIEGDRRVPFRLLYKVLFTCHQAGYEDLALAAFGKEEEKGGGV